MQVETCTDMFYCDHIAWFPLPDFRFFSDAVSTVQDIYIQGVWEDDQKWVKVKSL